MFKVTNLITNPLPLSTGASLVPKATTSMRTVGDKERSYEARGWMRIIEIPKKPAEEPATPQIPEDKSK
jgi:hypothetical protein